MTEDLTALVADWPVATVSGALIAGGEVIASTGDMGWTTRLASISKLLAAYAGLVAIEEETISLDQPAGPEGATYRHLLSHAAGYAFDSDEIIAAVGAKRIYSNTGIEVFADSMSAAAGMPFGEYLTEAVFRPLGMNSTELGGSPAHAVWSSLGDLVAFVLELFEPALVASATVAEATSVQFPGLAGVVPGVGRYDPNPWGLGFEIKGGKLHHWMGDRVSRRTYGHFGGAGTFLWVDPEQSLAAVVLTDREFGPWAMEAWPAFSDEIVRRYGEDRSAH
jgi:CubicO group peptidase (beta-lactamase class C family)